MNCKNCNLLIFDKDNFCNSCGAKVIHDRLTIKNLFEHFSEHFLNYDNKFLQTFIHLFTKPEVVIGGYIDGTRKKYVNVISYFAIALTLAGFQMFILNKFFPELMNMDMFTQDGMEEFQKNNMNFMQEYQSIVYMLIVPVYALVSKIIFYNFKKFNYTEHLVINMYLAAHFSIVSSILIIASSFLGINFGIVGIIVIPLQIIYSAYSLKRLFKISLKGIILRTLLFLLIFLVLFVISSIIAVVVMYFTGSMEEMIEAQKAAREVSKN